MSDWIPNRLPESLPDFCNPSWPNSSGLSQKEIHFTFTFTSFQSLELRCQSPVSEAGPSGSSLQVLCCFQAAAHIYGLKMAAPAHAHHNWILANERRRKAGEQATK